MNRITMNVKSPRFNFNWKFGLRRWQSSRATLTIMNGSLYQGESFGANRNISGEAVFTTSLVGYPESMTDPSFKGQILVFTQPLIGNYGVPSTDARDEFGLLKYFESDRIHCAGIVVADVCKDYSHWTARQSLGEWCKSQGVPAISGVDTRAIVTFLREQGSTLAKIAVGEEYDADEDEAYSDPALINLLKKVTITEPKTIMSGINDVHIAVIDCGVKENILRSLLKRGASITVFPYDYPIHEVAHNFDGVFYSNGPGDPTHAQSTVENLKSLINSFEGPIMGICLGHQLLALAAGAKTVKMKYGNRGHNIPALHIESGKCHITSQNHGYAVDASTLPSDYIATWRNLNDNSNEGICHINRPIRSVQFHPEAKGGPEDTFYLFDSYLDEARSYHKKHRAASATKNQHDQIQKSFTRDALKVELR